MNRKTLAFIFALIVIMGCSGKKENTSSGGSVSISAKLGSEFVSPGLSTTLTANVVNNYAEALENAEVRVIHSSDIQIGGDIKTGLTIPKGGTAYPIQWQVLASQNAIKRDYAMRTQLCFNYKSTAYSEIVFSSGPSTTTPQKGSGQGPMKVDITGLETGIDSRSVQSAFALLKINNVGSGRLVTNSTDSTEIVKLNITMDNQGGYLGVDNTQLTDLLNDPVVEEDKIKISTPETGLRAINGGVELVIPITISSGASEEIRTISVDADYTYCVDSSSITLTVK